eukprot:scaffold149719_cov32-Tisochrysis_lutea.AAC.2
MCWLHETSGFGVPPARIPSTNGWKTSCQYSLTKLTGWKPMPIRSQTRRASSLSLSLHWELMPSSSWSQFDMWMPTTSWPCRLRRRAATEESTPPETPTAMVDRARREAVQEEWSSIAVSIPPSNSLRRL